MKDRSRVDVVYAVGLMAVMGLSIYSINNVEQDKLLLSVALLLIINGFLVSIYIWNHYEITKTTLKLRFGPLKETIPLDKIEELRLVKNYWSSMALARKRIMVRYWYKGKFLTTTYISPMNLEAFLEELEGCSKNLKK